MKPFEVKSATITPKPPFQLGRLDAENKWKSFTHLEVNRGVPGIFRSAQSPVPDGTITERGKTIQHMLDISHRGIPTLNGEGITDNPFEHERFSIKFEISENS